MAVSGTAPRALDLGRFEGEVRVMRVLFAAEQDGFAVLACEAQDGEEVIVTGAVAHLAAGHRAQVEGEWKDHPRHGPQVEAERALELDPADEEGTLAYLTTIKHIGEHRAAWLLERYGEEVLERIDAAPERVLGSVPGVGRKGASEAARSWAARRAVRELYVLLAPHGLGWLASQLHRQYGPETLSIVREDPYRLTELHGVGFRTADALARSLGVSEDSPRRAHAAVVHALGEAEADGHTHLPERELVERVRALVGPIERERLTELEAEGLVVVEEERIYRAPTHRAERFAAQRLAALSAAPPVLDATLGDEPAEGLTPEQWEAVRAAFARRLSVVTGGPGTGKTTLIEAMVEVAARHRIDVALCAPTGRAARRLEEATGHRAVTIHRLLDWVPGEGAGHDHDAPLRCHLLVVDESSMLSLAVANMLLDAIGSGTHVVFVGDADQLPPVGAGKPFAELIDSGSAPVTRLTHIFRQAARSMIVLAAHAINRGERPATRPDSPEVIRDFFFVARRDATATADAIVEMATARMPEHLGVDPVRDVQVLAPIYRGPAGVDALNARLREALNPQGRACLNGTLRIGDKLIQTRNDYETGLMNGQLLVLTDADDDAELLTVETDDGRRTAIPYDATGSLRLGYAISVHKSQGCEVPVAVIALHRSHQALLSRNLLYTAVTRARRACLIVGEELALVRAIQRADAFRRHSRLAELIRAA